jgi:hypothetical protein
MPFAFFRLSAFAMKLSAVFLAFGLKLSAYDLRLAAFGFSPLSLLLLTH